MRIRIATVQDVPLLASLARQVWTEHYTPLLGNAQVKYMLHTFQSAGSIQNAIVKEGMVYYLLCRADGEPVGYCAWKTEDSSLFLSKLYILKPYRGKGFARVVLQRLEAIGGENRADRIVLTVNRYNTASIAVYKALGFSILREQVTDIGDGFVMDDFVLEKKLLCAQV